MIQGLTSFNLETQMTIIEICTVPLAEFLLPDELFCLGLGVGRAGSSQSCLWTSIERMTAENIKVW